MNQSNKHPFLPHALALTLPAGTMPSQAAEPASPPATTAPTVSTAGLEALAGARTKLRKGDKLAFFGDSITMQGGYIKLIEQFMAEKGGEQDVWRRSGAPTFCRLAGRRHVVARLLEEKADKMSALRQRAECTRSARVRTVL